MLPVRPQGRVVVHLNHARTVELRHAVEAIRSPIPGVGILRVHLLKGPNGVNDRLQVFRRYGIVNNNEAEIVPELHLLIRQDSHPVLPHHFESFSAGLTVNRHNICLHPLMVFEAPPTFPGPTFAGVRTSAGF